MENDAWVINASPLILLGKVGRATLAAEIAGSILIPGAVVREVEVREQGRDIMSDLRADNRFQIVEPSKVGEELLGWDLGAGETQVIAVAKARAAERVVLDDREARRCARALGLRVIGTLGIVGRARQRGLNVGNESPHAVFHTSTSRNLGDPCRTKREGV